MDVETILTPLRVAGLLYCHGSVWGKLHVQGGVRESLADGILTWEESFVIFEEGGKFTACVVGVRDHPRDDETRASSLEDAVRFVLQAYEKRR